MKKILMGIALLASLGLASAQTKRSPQEVMARAEQQIYSKGDSEATFVSTLLDAKGKEQGRYQGKIFLQGENFRLEYGDIIAVFSGKTLTHHDDLEETLTISTPTSEELLQVNPFHFLRARGKGFSVRDLGAAGTVQTLAYTPQGKSNIKLVTIAYNHTTGLPTSIVVLSKDNSRVQIALGSFRNVSKPFAKSFFSLTSKDFPKSEVVDLR